VSQETSRPAVEGWFATEPEPHLIGGRCSRCGTVVFPNNRLACPNPGCDGHEFEAAPLGRRARVWSFATNHYAPPEPYIAPDPFVPYTVVAAELIDEKLAVLGQLADGYDPAALSVGDEVELTVGALYQEEDGTTRTVWKWAPVGSGASAEADVTDVGATDGAGASAGADTAEVGA
jgi:uncharacterized OB-fold protein